MKKICLSIIVALASVCIVAQTPQAFKYQAIARDETGNILSIWDIGLRVSLIQKGSNGEAVYVETHKVQTNIYGLINLVIGEGNVVTGEFKSIKWGENRHYLKIEMDTEGGENYKEAGISQLYAVPYALYAENAGKLVDAEPSDHESTQKSPQKKVKGSRDPVPNSKFPADTNSFLNVNVGKVGIGTTDPQEKLDVIGKIMSTLGYNTNGDDGLNDTLNLVTNIRFDSLKLQYRTLAFSGGILTYVSDTSAWVDTVGNNIITFYCGDSLLDIRNMQKYGTVLIDTQCWMVENLNIGIKINSTTGGQEQTDNGEIEKYCYSNDISQCDIYGGLYEWGEAMQYVTTPGTQGICPDGWHIPTDAEWTTLTDYLGGLDVAGGKMKSIGIIQESTGLWYDPNLGATNESGFTGLPGGNRIGNGSFTFRGSAGYLWTSTENSGTHAYYRRLYYENASVYRGYRPKTDGFSVRCVQD